MGKVPSVDWARAVPDRPSPQRSPQRPRAPCGVHAASGAQADPQGPEVQRLPGRCHGCIRVVRAFCGCIWIVRPRCFSRPLVGARVVFVVGHWNCFPHLDHGVLADCNTRCTPCQPGAVDVVPQALDEHASHVAKALKTEPKLLRTSTAVLQ